ncbi:hypothetical protein RJ639_003903 [Escallonia herrerae]|uniref:BHLH domain-containing protein n=1 Tax=Escallonia herrerae TaxID=1293975 RepID=A0AA88VZT6_9ASTE|nr:hypothetical protein RJ639_003903 [Escallonia herrerae]
MSLSLCRRVFKASSLYFVLPACGLSRMKRSGSTVGTAKGHLDRKTVEKNRRIHMKGLCLHLTSLVPPQHFKPSKDVLSQQDQLEQVATYIKQLEERIKELKGKKELLGNTTGTSSSTSDKEMIGLKAPMIEIREFGSILEVVFVSGLRNNFMLCQVVNILEDEGAEVVSANHFVSGDKNFHSLHAQVTDFTLLFKHFEIERSSIDIHFLFTVFTDRKMKMEHQYKARIVFQDPNLVLGSIKGLSCNLDEVII